MFLFQRLFSFLKQMPNKRETLLIGILWKVLVVLSLPLIFNFFDFSFNTPVEDPATELAPPVPPHKEPPAFLATFANLSEITTLEAIKAHVFYVDSGAYVYVDDLPLAQLASLDLSLNLQGTVPRVLITHTHSQETFIDSEAGNPDHTIVGVGRYLAHLLANTYGISVVHDVATYDLVDEKRKISGSYERMELGVHRLLELYPSIEVIIDLHRDAAPEGRVLVTELDETPTAQLMFFNGITRRNVDGSPVPLDELFNPYLTENLALSLQLFLTANEHYPGLARRNYIKAYRYSLHMKPRSVLVEVGGHTNTLQEAKNAMYPLAHLLVEVLTKS